MHFAFDLGDVVEILDPITDDQQVKSARNI